MKSTTVWASVVVSVVVAATAILWCQLPRRAPRWVIAHSPWVEPMLRAGKAARMADQPYEIEALWRRLDSDALVPGLIQCLKHRDPKIRCLAAEAFECRMVEAERAVAPLTLALRDPVAAVRLEALSALGKQRFDDDFQNLMKSIAEDLSLPDDVRSTAQGFYENAAKQHYAPRKTLKNIPAP